MHFFVIPLPPSLQCRTLVSGMNEMCVLDQPIISLYLLQLEKILLSTQSRQFIYFPPSYFAFLSNSFMMSEKIAIKTQEIKCSKIDLVLFFDPIESLTVVHR